MEGSLSMQHSKSPSAISLLPSMYNVIQRRWDGVSIQLEDKSK